MSTTDRDVWNWWTGSFQTADPVTGDVRWKWDCETGAWVPQSSTGDEWWTPDCGGSTVPTFNSVVSFVSGSWQSGVDIWTNGQAASGDLAYLMVANAAFPPTFTDSWQLGHTLADPSVLPQVDTVRVETGEPGSDLPAMPRDTFLSQRVDQLLAAPLSPGPHTFTVTLLAGSDVVSTSTSSVNVVAPDMWPAATAMAEDPDNPAAGNSGSSPEIVRTFITIDGAWSGAQWMADAPNSTAVCEVLTHCDDLTGTQPQAALVAGMQLFVGWTPPDTTNWAALAPTDVTYTFVGYQADGLTETFRKTCVYHFI